MSIHRLVQPEQAPQPSVEKTFTNEELALYNALQFQHMEARYFKMAAGKPASYTLKHYLQHDYVRLGHAEQFHTDWMQGKYESLLPKPVTVEHK